MLFGYIGDVHNETHSISFHDSPTEGKVRVKIYEMADEFGVGGRPTSIRAEFDRDVFWRYVKPAEAHDG